MEDGATFAIIDTRHNAAFYVRDSELSGALDRLRPLQLGRTVTPRPMRTMDGESVTRLEFANQSRQARADEALRSTGVRTYEADLSLSDAYLADRGIRGSLTVSGSWECGTFVDRVYIDPDVEPAEWVPALTVLSIDIETELPGDRVLAIGLTWFGDGDRRNREVLLLGPDCGEEWITAFDEERPLLEAFVERIRAVDPDIITGWNVIDFDFRVLFDSMRRAGVRADFARSRKEAAYLTGESGSAGRNADVSITGRQVIDGLRLVRYGPERFDDRRLESVARRVLGYGKEVSEETSDEKIAELRRLYRTDPVKFASYCLTDAELVLDILRETGLLTLTVMRTLLTGASLNKAWTSIHTFELLYIEAMHREGLVAPTTGVDALPLGEAPGGAILTPHPGLFRNVLLFDFKSLYPSVILTFNIDPVSLAQPVEGDEERYIESPRGGFFRYETGILPRLLERFFRERAEAKERGDTIASYVYKIIMNSFYGVLGARGCRFAGSVLAGSITAFGQNILHWCRDRLRDDGYTVLYGDTDSLFVLAPDGDTASRSDEAVPPEASSDDLYALGDRIAERLNGAVAEYVERTYDRRSRLELEFEKVYRRFFLPSLRSVGEEGEARGRAKGYAGLAVGRDGEETIEVKGMEAARSDWTALAHEFQRALLDLIFHGRPSEEIAAYVRSLARSLRAGELDAKLQYAKRLRKPVARYTRSRPPHVKAASLLPPEKQEGTIRYYITEAGPRPEGLLEAPLDYEHYVDKQLKPIAGAFSSSLGFDLASVLDKQQQLSLF